MEVIKNVENNKMVITLVGRLDTNTAPQLESEVKGLDANITNLVYDFKDLEYVSSAGLRVLLLTQKMFANRGEFKIVNVSDAVMEVFEITGFDDILTIEK